MRLIQNFHAIGRGITASFMADDGVEPYTFSVLPNGAGGSVDQNGIYTPLNYGRDVVRVEDGLGDTEEAEILVLPPLGLVCDIIQKEMRLESEQVYIYNNKYNLPKNSKVYISVGERSTRPIANVTKIVGDKEHQSILVQQELAINIMSRSQEALYRKEELLLAFKSTYAQLQMTSNGFSVANMSTSLVNLSDLEGAAIPYRYHLSCMLTYSVNKESEINYYDKFDYNLITNRS